MRCNYDPNDTQHVDRILKKIENTFNGTFSGCKGISRGDSEYILFEIVNF